ncbi:amidohydrolase family protein [Flavihumibacter profundi]|uniref:amidohydrolase family protein n=1 Tax=Flavihumibacter profundi TaxID=2716883 RepID=UPI001CC45A2E|nr:amidohydrolase family protein [Flavihumibacter profundi]MBZ5858608.1 amidohydrolase family protein [Flavihumibacter profundi]
MGFRKFRADQVFTGHQFAPKDSILITDEKGRVEDIIPETEAGEDIETVRGILSPGFINCHCHLELSHMKGMVPPGTGMVNFLLAVMQQRHRNREQLLESIENAENEMLEAGIVAAGDICNTADTVLQKQKGRLIYSNFIECTGFVPASAGMRFSEASAVRDQLAETGETSFVPHAPYSVSPELFRLIDQSSEGRTTTMHNQESQAENDFFLTGESDFRKLYAALGLDIHFYQPPQKTSLQAVWPYLQSAEKLILVHNVYTSQQDIDALKYHGANAKGQQTEIIFCLCPNANLYINNNLPPVQLFLKNGYNPVLGTDSLSSNYQLSIIEEIKTLQQHFPELQLQQLLQWATSNGAAALGISKQYGSFEKGKKPGVVQIQDWSARRIL